MNFRLMTESGRNNHVYTAIDKNGHAIANVFKVGTANQDSDAGKGEYRISMLATGIPNIHRKVLVDSHDSIEPRIKELLSYS